jgi:serine/threonine protein kinase
MLMEFRLAKLGLESSSYTLCGTPEYLAPEQVRNQGHGKVTQHILCLIYVDIYHSKNSVLCPNVARTCTATVLCFTSTLSCTGSSTCAVV